MCGHEVGLAESESCRHTCLACEGTRLELDGFPCMECGGSGLRRGAAPLVFLRGGPAAGASIRWPREVLRFTPEMGGGFYALAGVESTVATWWPDLLTGERFPVDPACPVPRPTRLGPGWDAR